jgi:hypothetical protein
VKHGRLVLDRDMAGTPSSPDITLPGYSSLIAWTHLRDDISLHFSAILTITTR